MQEISMISTYHSTTTTSRFVVVLILVFSVLVILLLLLRIIIVYRTIQYNRRRVLQQQQQQQQKQCQRNQQECNHHQQYSSFATSTTFKRGTTTSINAPLRTLIVLGSGGHTTEILFMTQYLNRCFYNDNHHRNPKAQDDDTNHNNNNNNKHPHQNVGTEHQTLYFDPIYYCKASTDTTSMDRLYHTLYPPQKQTKGSDTNNNNNSSSTSYPKTKIEIYNIPRSREVGQSYSSSIYTTIKAILYCMKLIYTIQPNCIVCNGPGTCIPICLVVLLYRICNILPNQNTYIIFIESVCRVETLSLTGKILYYIADIFMIHWIELQQQYPNTILTNSFM